MSADTLLAADFAELRRQAAIAVDFNQFWDYYMTCFVERAGFLQLGRPIALDGAVEVLEATAAMMMERAAPVAARNLVLMEVPAGGIVHGSGVFDGRLAAVLYVPEIDMGMFALCVPGGGMRYARFWLTEEKALAARAC